MPKPGGTLRPSVPTICIPVWLTSPGQPCPRAAPAVWETAARPPGARRAEREWGQLGAWRPRAESQRLTAKGRGRAEGSGPGAWPRAGAWSGLGFTETYPALGRRARRLQLGAGERVASLPFASGTLSFPISGGEFAARPASGLLEGCEARARLGCWGAPSYWWPLPRVTARSKVRKRQRRARVVKERGLWALTAGGGSGAGARRVSCRFRPPPLHPTALMEVSLHSESNPNETTARG